MMQISPLIAIHLFSALTTLVLGPMALWARLGHTIRPRLHRGMGYAWVTCMLATAFSALFIHNFQRPNIAGYTPIHLLIVVTLISLYAAFRYLLRGNIPGHRRVMQRLYLAACIVAGLFTLMPHRYLGQLVWGQWLGWM